MPCLLRRGLCSGGMLYDRLAATQEHSRGYSERRAAGMLRQVVRVVAWLHAQGVIHRDLKLENFLLLSAEEDAPLQAIDWPAFSAPLAGSATSDNC